VAKDGEEFQLGKLKIKVLHTPGHTMESTCYLLIDENGQEKALLVVILCLSEMLDVLI
jgi:glyoxylase-like metal-dependent hydrolase (beta-lactamase superfamily II)